MAALVKSKMLVFAALILGIGCGGGISGTGGTIKGSVITKQGNPIANVDVRIEGSKNDTTTDSEGTFTLEEVGDDPLVLEISGDNFSGIVFPSLTPSAGEILSLTIEVNVPAQLPEDSGEQVASAEILIVNEMLIEGDQ